MKTSSMCKVAGILGLALMGLIACSRNSETDSPKFNAIERLEFNRLAAEQFLPIFWREDTNKDGALQPNELAILVGFGSTNENERAHWVGSNDQFTSEFATAYQQIVAAKTNPVPDNERLTLVKQELMQGRPTLVETDLSHASAADLSMVKHLMNAAKHIENIYQQQKGSFGLDATIPATDLASRMLFHRNQSPFCEAPKTERSPECNALSPHPERLSGLYPADIQNDKTFCDALSKTSNASDLMNHFTVVKKGDKPDTYKSVPYNVAYKQDMESIATELDAAADALGNDEAAFKNYLHVAAQGFRSNDWEPANRAWVAMNATNSKWYARIAPDEVYYEPCAWKAGFALQLAHINTASLAWQQKLEPLKNEMEQALATMAGAPYKARDVKFKVPDFIDVVLNAGDQRNAFGATIGQSLPNWGSVAESGGRTVAMTNLFTDADSNYNAKQLMSSIFCVDTNKLASVDPENSVITSLLHEMAHNLGPSHEYRVNGKTDVQAFGGPLSSTLEELKAQTSAMFLTDWLAQKSIFAAQRSKELHTYDITWMMSHISRGMYTADGKALNYSQLAAIQLGWLMQQGSISWHPEQMAANAKDKGCMEIDFNKLPTSIQSLEARVLQIKARNDKQSAEQLKAQFVDAQDDYSKLKQVIAERWLRNPKSSLVYGIRY